MRPEAGAPVVHLELHTADGHGAQELLCEICGWQPKRIHAGAASYLALELGRGLGGGIVECDTRRSLWLPYVEVRSIGAVTERARALGASVLLERREGSAGNRSVVATPAGAELALWQPRA